MRIGPAFKGIGGHRAISYDEDTMKKCYESNLSSVVDLIDGHRVDRLHKEIVNLVSKGKANELGSVMSMTSVGDVWGDTRVGGLEAKGAKLAREEDMKLVRQRKVYDRVPWKRVSQRNGKTTMKLRCVDANKATEQSLRYRSRIGDGVQEGRAIGLVRSRPTPRGDGNGHIECCRRR